MSARPQVTITLGRTGQVVKKEVSHTGYEVPSGRKRPIRERLGNHADSRHSHEDQYKDKRQRTENHDWSSSDDDLIDEKQYTSSRRVGRDDLRFKLIHKSLSKRGTAVNHERNGADLREKLSRNSHTPLRLEAREHISDSRQHISDSRQRASDSRQRASGSRQHISDSRAPNLVKRIPPTRSADDLLELDSLRRPYSSTLNGMRHRSPDKILSASRDMSPLRNYDNMRHVASVRSIGAPRPTSFVTKTVADPPRTMSFMSKPTGPTEASKLVLRAPPPGGIVQKASYMPDEQATVAGLLNSLGLGKYAILFQAEEVDMPALKQMGDNDLKELGIPMGPRKKILLAVMPRSKQRHP